MTLILAYSSALLLGTLHALEPDHMAAVTSFAVRRPGAREAFRFGVRWAVGHGAAIIIIGTGLLMLGLHLPESTTHWLERAVGLVMIGLGVWTFLTARALFAREHEAALHPASAARPHGDHDHDHDHAITAVGMVHGLAGSGSAVALIPVIGFDTAASGIAYLAVFAIGTITAMALYGLLAGVIVGRAAHTSGRLARLLARFTGVFTVIIGFIWLIR